MGFIKLVVFGFIGLSVIYLSISFYSRSVRKERLENEYDAANPDGGEDAARDAFVADGLKDYNNSIRPKLIGLVFVIPPIVVSAIAYTMNTN